MSTDEAVAMVPETLNPTQFSDLTKNLKPFLELGGDGVLVGVSAGGRAETTTPTLISSWSIGNGLTNFSPHYSSSLSFPVAYCETIAEPNSSVSDSDGLMARAQSLRDCPPLTKYGRKSPHQGSSRVSPVWVPWVPSLSPLMSPRVKTPSTWRSSRVSNLPCYLLNQYSVHLPKLLKTAKTYASSGLRLLSLKTITNLPSSSPPAFTLLWFIPHSLLLFLLDLLGVMGSYFIFHPQKFTFTMFPSRFKFLSPYLLLLTWLCHSTLPLTR